MTRKRPILTIVLAYAAFILLCTVVLKLPFLLIDGSSITWLESFFTANSAVSTTGLSVVDVYTTFNYLGMIVLIIIFNIGGMGIIVLNTLVLLFIGKKIGYKYRYLAKMDYNQSNSSNIVTIVMGVFKIFITVELVGAFLIFLANTQEYVSVFARALDSLYLASSAISGSGFYNMVPFANDYFIQWVCIILMIVSFIGYPVLLEFQMYFKARRKKEKFAFSRFTKIVLKVNIFTVLAWAIIFFLLERGNSMADYGMLQQMQVSFFTSISTKSVGLSLFADITTWLPATQFICTIFMLIGGSPSSACGGIKVVAIYVVYKHVKSMILGRSQVVYDNMVIANRTIINSYLLTLSFIVLSILTTVIISVLNPNILLGNIWFDVVSGFTTTGFSTGALALLGNLEVFLLAILMGVGRIGIMNLYNISYTNDAKVDRVTYLERDLPI